MYSQDKLDYATVTNNSISMDFKKHSFISHIIVHGVLVGALLIIVAIEPSHVAIPKGKQFLGVLCILEITHVQFSLVRTVQSHIQPQWSQEICPTICSEGEPGIFIKPHYLLPFPPRFKLSGEKKNAVDSIQLHCPPHFNFLASSLLGKEETVHLIYV